MESIDDLLSQVKSEYAEQDQPQELKKLQLPKEEKLTPQKPLTPVIHPWEWEKDSEFSAEDSLISQVKAELEEQEKPKKPQPLKIDFFTESQPVVSSPAASMGGSRLSPAYEDKTLSQVKVEIEEQARLEQLKKQQQLREEQLKAEQELQQQREVLKKEAEAWLKKLKPLSEEGLWFEEFAYAYPAKLDAAIDYLQALRETQA